MTREEVVALMESSKTADEWDANVDKVKDACGGYPPFWYSAIIASGLVKRVSAGFGEDGEIHISAIRLRNPADAA